MPPLVLVIGAARSGTTLLRLLLDAHPEIGAPAEAGLPLIAHEMVERVWTALGPDDETMGPMSPDFVECARNTLAVPMRYYLRRHGKRIYCDKSLDSVRYLGSVEALFPDLKVVFVYRQVMDTIFSGIEASTWGFSGFGYAPYVQSNPTNIVEALGTYWLHHVSDGLNWEASHDSGRCFRVPYEQLVRQPQDILPQLFAFLGVTDSPEVAERAFADAAWRGGNMDYKIGFTTGIHDKSIGRGRRVPIGRLPANLLDGINDALSRLGYEPMDARWNATTQNQDGAAQVDVDALGKLMDALVHVTPDPESGAWGIVAQDSPQSRWCFDPADGSLRRGDGEIECALVGDARDLMALFTQEHEVGPLLRDGRIRFVSADDSQAPPWEVRRAIVSIVGNIRAGLVDSAVISPPEKKVRGIRDAEGTLRA